MRQSSPSLGQFDLPGGAVPLLSFPRCSPGMHPAAGGGGVVVVHVESLWGGGQGAASLVLLSVPEMVKGGVGACFLVTWDKGGMPLWRARACARSLTHAPPRQASTTNGNPPTRTRLVAERRRSCCSLLLLCCFFLPVPPAAACVPSVPPGDCHAGTWCEVWPPRARVGGRGGGARSPRVHVPTRAAPKARFIRSP